MSIISSGSVLERNISEIISKKFQTDFQVVKLRVTEVDKQSLDKSRFVVTLGSEAAELVSNIQTKSIVINSLISTANNLNNNSGCFSDCYSIFINQPVRRYLALFKNIFSSSHRLVFLKSENNTKMARQVLNLSNQFGIKLKQVLIKDNENLSRELLNTFTVKDVLLALPDSHIYNSRTAKSIILTSYHADVPIISYSSSFARAGALIALYSSVENITDKTVSVIEKLISKGSSGQKEYYPDNFEVEVNAAVARSLNIHLKERSELKRIIK